MTTDPATTTEPREEREENESRIYELGYLLISTISSEEVPREVTAIKDLLEKEEARVFAEEFPRFRPLAYRMEGRAASERRGFTDGYFGWMKFECSTEAAKRLPAALHAIPSLLRFLLFKTVREDTRSTARPPRADFRRERKEPPKAAPAAPAPPPVSEVELEKAMEKIL